MRLRYSKLAAADIRDAVRRWKGYEPPASGYFREDLARVRKLLAVVPNMGAPAAEVLGLGLRRVLLRRTGYWLYYSVNESMREIEVLRLWHPKRGPVEGLS